MNKPSLLILAAGIGSRYGGFKQIAPIGPHGEIIIDYSIYDALRAGFGKIIILTRPELEEPIREHFKRTLGGFELCFAFQNLDDLPGGLSVPLGRQKPWGTGHAVWAARRVIDAPFAVINADDFYGARSYKALSDFLVSSQPGEFCMCGFDLSKTLSDHGTVSRGICQADAGGYLVDVVENTTVEPDLTHGARTKMEEGAWQPLSPQSIASMNLWGFDPTIMAHLKVQFLEFLTAQNGNLKSEFFIPTAIDLLIKQGKARCKVIKTDEQWFGMTYKEDRELAAAAVQTLIARNVYPPTLR